MMNKKPEKKMMMNMMIMMIKKDEDAASHIAINLSVLGAFDKHRHAFFFV